VIKTIPPAGTTLAPGKKLTLVVSAGEPHVIFSNNRSIEQIDSATLKPLAPVASGPPAATDPTYSADGSSAAYVANGQVMLKDLTAQHAAPEPLTAAGPVYTDLAWAPTADVNVLAMAQERGDVIPALGYRDTDLCLARVTTHGLTPHCKTEPGFLIERQIRWTSDGTTLLAGAVKTDGSGAFGVVRWRLEPGRRPFSTDPADWTSGDFVTDITQPHRGALDAAVSPDGKTLAVVSDFNGGIFRLWLSPTPDDFLLANAKPTSVRACQVTWRPDSRELLVIQQAASCGDRGNLGSLVRVPLDDLGAGRTLAASADDPSYQPVNIGS
jgi:WD40 repeat protein